MLTSNDFNNFTNFALPLVQSGRAESLEQLLREWQTMQEEQEEVARLFYESLEDVKAGRGIPAEQVIAEVREKLGLK